MGFFFNLAEQRLAGADDLLLVSQRLAGVFSKEVEIRFADELAAVRHLEEFLEGLAAPDEAGLAVFEVNAVRTVVQQGAQQIPLIRQRRVGLIARGDVTEAPDAADRHAVQALRAGVALEYAPVFEFEHVGAFRLAVRINLPHLAPERLGVLELAQDVGECDFVVARVQDVLGNPP